MVVVNHFLMFYAPACIRISHAQYFHFKLPPSVFPISCLKHKLNSPFSINMEKGKLGLGFFFFLFVALK